MSPERKYKRIRVTRELQPIPAAFETDNVRGEGYIGSLSHESLFFATETVLTVGELVIVIFSNRSGSKIEVGGTVGWTTAQVGLENCPNSGFGMHLEFLTYKYLAFYKGLLTS